MTKRFLIKYRGHLSCIAKKDEEWIESGAELSIDELLTKLSEKYHDLAGGSIQDRRLAFLITINEKFCPSHCIDGLLIKDGDVVSLFPPVAGG
jgi:molybdopterin converting factor small subunit